MRLHHLALKSKDPADLGRFYREVLGLPEEKRHHDEHGLRSIWLGIQDAILMIERSDSPGESQAKRAASGASGDGCEGFARAGPDDRPDFDRDPPGLHLLAFAIDPSEAPTWRAKLTILKETSYTLYFADPEGNRVALSSYPELLDR